MSIFIFSKINEVATKYQNHVKSLSIIQRKVLTPNDFADLEALRLRLALYEELSNQCPIPFQWKFDRAKLTALIAKIEARQRALAEARFACLKKAAYPGHHL